MDTLGGQPNQPAIKTLEITLPDTSKVLIREQNGNDEDVISQVADGTNLAAISRFISGIILEPKLSWQKVHKFKNLNRYYILLESRIFNFGAEFIFKHTFKDGLEVEFEEDLKKYLVDFNNYEKFLKETEAFEFRPTAYPNKLEAERKLTLQSGREVKYMYLTGEAEEESVKIGTDKIRQNDIFRIRKLSIQDSQTKTGWKEVENFKDFSAKEMQELRRDVGKNDVAGLPFTLELQHPEKPEIKEYQPIIAYPEFFFPV